MKRTAKHGWTVIGVLVSLAVVAVLWASLWTHPDLSGYSDSKLRVEAWTLFIQTRHQPWFIAWAPALRHGQIHREMIERGVLGIH